MKEYIERAAILKSLGYDEKRRADVLPGSTFDIVLKEAAADVAEVRHGRWILNLEKSRIVRSAKSTATMETRVLLSARGAALA